jgi:hypothetical protein
MSHRWLAALIGVAIAVFAVRPADARTSDPPGTKQAVSEKTEAAVKELMRNVREGGVVDDRPVLALPSGEAVVCLSEWLKDPVWKMKSSALRLICMIAQKEKNPTVRRQALLKVLDVSCEDRDIGENAAAWLLTVPADELPADCNARIEKALSESKVIPGVIRLAGHLHLAGSTNRLRELAEAQFMGTDREGYQGIGWASALALARMGDDEATRHVVKRVQGERNDITRVTSLVEDLAYTGRAEAIKPLIANVLSTKRLPPVEALMQGEPFGMRSLEVLARTVEGFPLAAKEWYEFSEQDLVNARLWLQKQKKISMKNSKEEVDVGSTR